MLQISTKGYYGLMAMVELGFRNLDDPVQIQEIANKRSIPQSYLEQILVGLRKANLVKSYRGAQGGYTLAREANQITVGEIIQVLEGDLDLVPAKLKGLWKGQFWTRFEKLVREYLEQSLDSLVQEEKTALQEYIYVI